MTDEERNDEASRRETLRKRLSGLNRAPLSHEAPLPQERPGDVSREDLRKALRSQTARGGASGRRKAPSQPGRMPVAPAAPTPPKQSGNAASAGGEKPEAIVYGRSIPRRQNAPQTCSSTPAEPVVLEEAVSGEEIACAPFGKCFLVSRRVSEIDGAGAVDQAFAEALPAEDTPLWRELARTRDPAGLEPDDVIFLDLETTGLSNSPLFLIGVMVWEEGGFETRQFLARHYAEEPAAIAAFVETCAPRSLLVTFNGKSFDFPYVRARAAANGIPFGLDPDRSRLQHFDLLHVSRRLWRGQFPDCKLQTLERYVCGRARIGDIPGSEIPEAYHAYVRTGNAYQIVDALEHNMLDLVTLADLMTRFPDP